MRLAAIVAMSENRVIGKNNELPWHLPADLAHFKKVTMGKPILMGRKTFLSIGRPLPGRCNVIITHDVEFQAEGCVIANSIPTALAAVSYSDEAMVIGGALLYQQMLPMVERLYLTLVKAELQGDAFFPEISWSDWEELQRIDYAQDEKNQYPFSFLTLQRKG